MIKWQKHDKIKLARHLLIAEQYSYRAANGVLFDIFGKGMALKDLQMIKTTSSIPSLTLDDLDAMKSRLTDEIARLQLDIQHLHLAITLLDQVAHHVTLGNGQNGENNKIE